MGNGHPPPGIDPLHTIDDGTLARIGSPPPGAIGLDAKGGSAKQSAPSIADRILSFVRRQQGQRYGNGECFTLVDSALGAASARTARDYGTVTPNADYVWGDSVNLSELRAGDIVQFRDYSYERVTVTEDDSGTTTDEHAEDRPHHTAVVQSVGAGGAVTVWEQNSPPGSAVRRTTLYFTGGTTSQGSTTTRITVSGSFWFYRPQSR